MSISMSMFLFISTAAMIFQSNTRTFHITEVVISLSVVPTDLTNDSIALIASVLIGIGTFTVTVLLALIRTLASTHTFIHIALSVSSTNRCSESTAFLASIAGTLHTLTSSKCLQLDSFALQRT